MTRTWPASLLALLLSSLAASEAAAEGPAEPGRFEVEILTIEPGDDPTNMFGHSALRVVDHVDGTDWVFNWGTLEWAPDITERFVAGPLTYFLSVEPFSESIGYYREENRRVVGQGLDLRRDLAARLVEAVFENAQPERRDYAYHHFRDNCATRVRDVVDEASEGALRRVGHDPSGRSYREHLYFGGAPPLWVVLGFDLTANATWDQEPNDWAATFLPANLRHLAARARLATGRPLVYAEQVYLERRGPDPAPAPLRPGWILFGLPALLLALALLLGHSRASRPLGATGLALLGLLAGLGALVGVAAWTLTAHTDFEGNECLLQLWPTDLALVVLGPLATSRKRARPRLRRALHLYFLAHAATSALALALLAAGVLTQTVWPTAAPTLAALALAALVTRNNPSSR